MLNRIDLTLEKALQQGIGLLRQSGIENPRLEAELLLSYALGISRSRVVLDYDKIISEDNMRIYENLLQEKINGTPTAYILKCAEFYGREFYVNKSTLVPRPETEELVEWIIQSRFAPDSILDLCTGSGCIGITLACELRPTFLCLSDKSEQALHVAQKNADKILSFESIQPALKKEILESDLFNKITKKDFDLIVSNPPYVTPDEYESLDVSVKNFEPRDALLVEEPGKFNTRLIRDAFGHLRPSGWIYLETSPTLAESLRYFFEASGFQNIEVKKDLAGKDRFVRARKPALIV